MNEQEIERIALEMMAAQDGVQPLPPFTQTRAGFDLEAAYAVAARIHAVRCAQGRKPVGRKIGFTNYAMWDLYGVRAPIWAYMYDTTVEYISGRGAECDISRFVEARIEPEIVFRFSRAPSAGMDAAALLGCIDGVAFGFEVVQSHFPDWRFQAADTVADGSLHARLFVGDFRAPHEQGADPVAQLATFKTTMGCAGRAPVHGGGPDVLGSPLNAVLHLIDTLASQGVEGIQAGEVVTTGTLTPAQPVAAGEVWEARLDGLACRPFGSLSISGRSVPSA